MRLTNKEADAIREEVSRLDPEAELYLYRARVGDAARGGDIDLLVVSDKLALRDVLRLRIRILDRTGWPQLDLMARRHNQLDDTIATLAKTTGQRL